MIRLDAVLRSVAGSYAALPRIDTIARVLPAGLTDTVYFEHWLSPGSTRVDMICRVTRAHRALLTSVGQQWWLPAETRAHAAWRQVAQFADAWESAGSLLDSVVQHLWLEFDLPDDDATDVPAPGVFLDFAPHVYESPDRTAQAFAAQAMLRALVPSLAPATLRTVSHSLESLPPGATMPYLGVLLPRGDAVVRICVDGLHGAVERHYLQTIGWRASESPLDDALHRWHASGAIAPAPSLLHLDLADGPLPSVARELKCARAAQVHARLDEAAFFREARHRGALSDALCAHLLAWPGIETRALPGQFWTSLVQRRFNHLKLAQRPDGTVAAKAYVAVAHRHYRSRRQGVSRAMESSSK